MFNSSSALSSPSLRFRSLLRACARRSLLGIGLRTHAVVITSGIVASPGSFLRNALLQLYAACGRVSDAYKVFDEIPLGYRDAVDWTTLMGCVARQGMLADTIRLFTRMRREGLKVDDVSMVCVFSACARLGDFEVAAQGHGCLVKMGFGLMVKPCNAVMDVYVKSGLLDEAKRVFEDMLEPNVVSWTVILDGVLRSEGVVCGRMVFDRMPEKNEVAWTIMIAGYLKNGLAREGLSLLQDVVFNCGFQLNYITLCSLLSACSQSGDLITGRWVHAYAIKTLGKDMDILVSTALVDMYSKCGRIDNSLVVFECMPIRNVVAWNAMISALAMHGRGQVVLNVFSQMVKEVKPDELTFTSLLSACSHSGLVDQGYRYFRDIEIVYGMKPTIEHYACMVDLLGRAGRLCDAEELIKKMPMRPNEVVLGSLLGSCSLHGKLQLGEKILQELVEIYPPNTEYHTLLSNMYVLAGKLENANSLRQVFKSKGVRKVPGMSSIHVGGQVHHFTSGDKSH